MIIGAVIVTYNPSLKDLSYLLKSICNSVKKIVVVDNCSSNVKDILKMSGEFNISSVLLLDENKGIGHAQNRGIENLFEDTNINGVILFDHDSLPSLDMIDLLKKDYLKLKDAEIKVGAVGPVFMDPRTGNKYPIPVFSGFSLHKIFPKPNDITPVVTSFLIASGCLIPREVLQKIGYMNEGFFIDYIDIEWSFRAQSNGYKLFTCPSAKMDHQIGDKRLQIMGREIAVHSPLRRYYLARNSILIIKLKHIDWRYKMREFFYSISRVIVFIATVEKKSTYLKYIFKGWYDGIIGKDGKMITASKLNNL